MSNNFFDGIKNFRMPERTIKQVKETATKHLEEVVNPFFDYLEENQPVFTGEINNEINKYNARLYMYGQAVRKGEIQHTFEADA